MPPVETFLDPETVNGALELIERYGYFMLVIGALLQGVGLPLPAQTILLAAGVLAGQGVLDPFFAGISGLLGAIVGSQVGYLIGRRGGRPFVLRWGRYVKITPERMERVETLFDRYGDRAVLVARFIPFLKTFGYLSAGTVGMSRIVFLRNDVIGTTAWVAFSVLLGVLLSEGVMALIT
ncbi:putative membrane-associated protein [Rubrobacter radiotolerans]|uniref:DedA family protein n=1 Tax=Rubrobacter radiotolerans TaxID=42256 RepID=A0A023X0S3_RUBRA|nr:DedA family protein [Rubrobacter radiotolerans]AHY45659.1 putative membrane-associated protein [Rubrobacter radiotolerans]MDX5893073.1 DedA family protein [Rubrobacter radiotolerans]SMC03007.1 membrane protein DedA, SNARE-associated domain [Rubrobacter radiotolerans DSM 5868]